MDAEHHEMLVRIDERVAVLVERDRDQEKRLRSLERFRNWAIGIIGVVASATGIKVTPLL